MYCKVKKDSNMLEFSSILNAIEFRLTDWTKSIHVPCKLWNTRSASSDRKRDAGFRDK